MAFYEDILVDRNGRIKCVLCKVYIADNDKVIEEHLQNEEHIQSFLKRLMIKNNVTLGNNNIFNCGICNEELDMASIINHVYSKNHGNSYQTVNALVENDGGFLQLPESTTNRGSNIYCLICDRSINFELGKVKCHLSSPRHQRARAIAVQPLNGIFSIEGSNDDLYCKICKVYFENYIETIFEHVDNDPKHAEKLGKILKLIDGQGINIEEFLHNPTEDKGMCSKCEIKVSCNVDNLYGHVKGKKHSS